MKTSLVLSSLLCMSLSAACQETKLENSTPSSADAGRKEETRSNPSDERVNPPVPIAGVYLNAQVIQETVQNNSAEAKLGISSYYNGIKVTDQRERFMVTLSAAPTAANAVNITQEQIPTGDYDHTVTIQGATLEDVRAAYRTIQLYVTIFDRIDNTTDTWSTPVDAVLQDSSTVRVKQTSTAGQAGTAGTP